MVSSWLDLTVKFLPTVEKGWFSRLFSQKGSPVLWITLYLELNNGTERELKQGSWNQKVYGLRLDVLLGHFHAFEPSIFNLNNTKWEKLWGLGRSADWLFHQFQGTSNYIKSTVIVHIKVRKETKWR